MKKPQLPNDYKVSETAYEMDESEYNEIKMKDTVWSLARLDVSDSSNGVKAVCPDQKVPSWGGFNALMSENDVPMKVIGFLPVIPHPVTSYQTVFIVLLNFQNVLSQLSQSKMAIACDEGVYQIA